MQTHEQRVVMERDELEAKIVKLEGFLDGAIFKGMEYTDLKLLRIQLMAMMTYCEILSSRIGRFT